MSDNYIQDEYTFVGVEKKERHLLSFMQPEHVSAIKQAHTSLIDAPVDLEKLAESVDVEYKYGNMPSGIYGSIKKTGGKKYKIKIRKADVWVRRRFTFAHELAHFFLHFEGKSGVGLENVTELREDVFLRSDATTNIHEWQANRLAAYILMPIDKIQVLQDRFSPLDLATVAQVFDVSQQAMQIRLGLPPDVVAPAWDASI